MTTALARLLSVSLASVALVVPVAAQEIPEGWEQGIFQLSIIDLPRTAMPVLAGPAGELLFPVAPILTHGGVPIESDPRGYAISLVDAERRALPARVDTIARTVTRGTPSWPRTRRR